MTSPAIVIKLPRGVEGFAEDKDLAREVRLTKILPSLGEGSRVVLDFSDVRYATQSFVHALIGEALKKYGEGALDQMEFRNCSPALRSVVSLVVDYSLSGFPAQARKL